MNDYLKAAMLRKEDDIVPPQYQAEVAQARYDQLSAADKLIANASTWAPRASDYTMFDMPEQVKRGATKLQESGWNILGEIEKFVGARLKQGDARYLRTAAENVGTPALDESQTRAITGNPSQYNAYLFTEFLKNHGAEKAAEFSGNKNVNWNRHTSDFLNWLAEGVEDQAALITKVGEAHAPEGYREGAYYGATKEGQPTENRPVPTNPFTGEAVLQGQYDTLHGGKAPQGKVKGLIEAALAITPDTLYSLGEYYAANVVTKPIGVANAVHMGIVDAIHAYQNNTDVWKGFASGVFNQQVVFRGLGMMTRVPRAIGTAAYFGGKEAIEAGATAPSGQFMTTAADTFLDPVNLTNTLTMVLLGQTHGGGKPLPELGREFQYWASNLPREARIHLDTAALSFKTLTLGNIENEFERFWAEGRKRFAGSTMRYYRAVTEPAKVDAEGNVIEPETVRSPAFFELLLPGGHSVRQVLMVGPDGNPSMGIPDYLYTRTGRALTLSINSDGTGNLHGVVGETREIGPKTALIRYAKYPGDRIPAGVYGVAEGMSYDSRPNESIISHEMGHLAISIGKTNAQRADMIIDMGKLMPADYATQEEIAVLAEKVRNLPPDPNTRTPLTKKEVEIYQNAEEMHNSHLDSASRGIGAGRYQAPGSIRQSLDFLTNLAHTIFRPEHNEAIWQIYRSVSSAARSIHETYGRGQSGYQYLPEVYREGREGQRASSYRDEMGNIKRVWTDENESPEGFTGVVERFMAKAKTNRFKVMDFVGEQIAGEYPLFILPDGRVLAGPPQSHDAAASLIGGRGKGQMVTDGAVRVAYWNPSGTIGPSNKMEIELYYKPTQAQAATLDKLRSALPDKTDITVFHQGKEKTVEELKTISLEELTATAYTVIDIPYGLGPFLRGERGWTAREALRTVTPSMFTKTEKAFTDSKTIPDAGVDPDRLLNVLSNKYQVGKEEVKRLRLDDMVRVYRAQNLKITRDNLKEWVMNYGMKLHFNREGGKDAYRLLNHRLEDAGVRAQAALEQAGVEKTKAADIVWALMGGHKTKAEAAGYKYPVEEGDLSGGTGGGYARIDKDFLERASGTQAAKMEALGIESVDQLKDIIGENYQSVEPVLQEVLTEAGARNTFMHRMRSTEGSVSHSQYTQLKPGIRSPAPEVTELVQCIATYDFPNKYSREFFTPEEAKAFFQDWYQQNFTWKNESGGNIEANETINADSAYPERGQTPLIAKTSRGTWEIPYSSFESTSLASDSHSFNKAWRGTGNVGWFRGGMIPLPNGKRAYLNAEVQGDAVQNIEDQGVRDLPIPKATIEQARKDLGENIAEGEVEAYSINQEAFNTSSDFFWKKKFSVNMPEDYIKGTGGYTIPYGSSEQTARENRSMKGGTFMGAIRRLRIALNDSVENHQGPFYGYSRQEQRMFEHQLGSINTGLNNLSAIRGLTPEETAKTMGARHPDRTKVPIGGEDWYEVGLLVSALNNPKLRDLLFKATSLKPEDIPGFITAPANSWDSFSTQDFRELGANTFTTPAGTSYFIGMVPAGRNRSELDPRKPDDWNDRIIYGADRAEAERITTEQYQKKLLTEWLQGAPDAPWAEAWREQLVMESLRYAAEAGYDYYTQRTAYHTFLEWGTQAYYWAPKAAVTKIKHMLEVNTAGGQIVGAERELNLPPTGKKYNPRWDDMLREVGSRETVANSMRREAETWDRIVDFWQNGREDQLGEYEKTELKRVRDNSVAMGNGPNESITHVARRLRQAADRIEHSQDDNPTVESALRHNAGSDAIKAYFYDRSATKYTVYRAGNDGKYDHTFTAPEFDTEQEAQAWADAWLAGDGSGTEYRYRWNEPWTDTTAELHYGTVKVGDKWFINKYRHGDSSVEVVGEYATKEEAEAAKQTMPRTGPISKWSVQNSTLRGGGPDNDPETFLKMDPSEIAQRVNRGGGIEITKFEDIQQNMNTGKERWAHGLWNRMQKSPQGGAFFPRYEGQKYNYETVLPNILKKRIKKFGIEPVLMSTVDMGSSDKPLEARVNKVVQEIVRPAQAWSEDAYGQELQRIHRAIVPAVQALGEDGIAELTRLENDFRTGNRTGLINWVREAQRRAGVPPDAFTNWETNQTTTQEVYYVKVREAENQDWVTIRLDGVNDQATAEAVAAMFLGYGKRVYNQPSPDLTFFKAEQRLPGAGAPYIIKSYKVDRSPTSLGGVKVSAVGHSQYNTMLEAQAKATELNNQMLVQMTGYRETMVIGFPITPELRSDLLYTSRSRYKMREVPAVTLQPATEEELAQFKDLIDPEATPELITKGKVLGINLDKVRTVEDVKRAISATEAIYSHYIDKERRGERSHAQTVSAAKALGMTVDELLSRPEAQAYNAEQMHAAFNLTVASGRVLKEMAGYLSENPTEENNARFAQALGLHKQIQAKFAGARAEAGRSVEILKVGASGEGQYLSSIGEALMRVPGATPQQVAEMVSKLPTLEQTSRFVKQMEQATTKDVLMEIWINGLLSGPKTQSANIIGNMATTVLGPIERLGAGITSEGGGVYPTESVAMGVGFVTGMYDALRIATHNAPWNWAEKMAETRNVSGDTSKLDIRTGAISSKQLGLTGPIGFFVDGIGKVIRIPGGALDTMDQIFKLVNFRMELNAQALRTALNEGARGKDIVPRVREILEGRDTEVLDLIRARANEWSDYQTFTKELGPTGKSLMAFSNSKWWAKMIMPFIRTPANIFKYGMERMPFMNLLLQSTRADLAAGGVRRDMAMGRISTSAMVLGVAYALAKAGAISGYGPQDKNLRKEKEATGWLPYAIRSGDRWYSYNRVEPFGALLGVTASLGEMWDDLPNEEAEAVLLAATLAFSQAMVSKSYMKGVSDVLTAVADPGANTEKVLRSYLGSAIPTVLNQADSAMFDKQIREVWTRMDALKDRVPGLSSTLPPKRDAFGHPMFYPDAYGPDFVSPIATRTKKSYPAMEELLKQGVPVGPPPRWVFGDRPSGLYTSPLKAEDLRDGVELNHNQYDRLSVLRGQMAEGALLEAMANPQYNMLSDGPDGGKAKVIKDIFYKSTAAARAKLLSEDKELEFKVTNKIMRRAEGMRAPENNIWMSP